jgi:Lrp/AsnC family transcriptional regulator of ectoine degradation
MRGEKLDAIDLKILSVLQRQGRVSKSALAEQVNLSPTPCWARLKKLEKSGLIRGYRTDVAVEKLAPFISVIVEVTLKQHRYNSFEIFERHVRDVPEIVDCHATGGGVDYFLKVVAADIERYQAIIDALLRADIGIDRYFTYVVTRAVKKAAQPDVALVSRLKRDGAGTPKS